MHPTKDNVFRAVAINNQGAVVCEGQGVYYNEATNRYRTEYWSFISKDGVIVAGNLQALPIK